MTVELARGAAKDLEQLDPSARRQALTALQQLETTPEKGHRLKGSLRGVRSLPFSAPGGAYRAAYIIYHERCVVFLIGSHEGFYALATRRYRALSSH